MDAALQSILFETLVSRRAAQFRFVRDLVTTPSQVPPGDEGAAADVVERALRALGLAVETHAVPDDAAAAHGLSGITNLVVRFEFGPGPVIALAAYGDTAPAGEGWSTDPLKAEIRDGVLTGLGALSKADVAVYAHALAALIAAGRPLAGTVELHVTFDGAQEGETGPKWLLDNGIVNPDYAIASGYAHGIGTSAMGDLQMAVDISRLPVRAAGAAGAPPGDPLEAATRVSNALYDLRTAYEGVRSTVPGIGQPTLVIGAIEGGERADRTPERVSMRLDRRMIPEENPATVEMDLTGLITQVAGNTTGIACKVRRLKAAPPMKEGPATKRLVAAIKRRARDVMGEDIAAYGVPYDANSRHYAAVGIPTVLYGAGPARRAGETPGGADERLVLDDVRKATEVVALSLADFLAPVE